MTVENVLTNVLLEIGLSKSSPQISSTDYDLQQIRQFMNAAGDDIASRVEWSALFKDLTVSGGLSEVILPTDFAQMAEGGAVRLNKTAGTFTAVRPIIAPEQWAMLSQRPSSQPFYHLADGKILFSPTLDADGAIVRYVSKQWISGKDQIEQNADVPLIPERLLEKGTIWRWKRQKGLPFDDFVAEFEADLITEIKRDRGQK